NSGSWGSSHVQASSLVSFAGELSPLYRPKLLRPVVSRLAVEVVDLALPREHAGARPALWVARTQHGAGDPLATRPDHALAAFERLRSDPRLIRARCLVRRGRYNPPLLADAGRVGRSGYRLRLEQAQLLHHRFSR